MVNRAQHLRERIAHMQKELAQLESLPYDSFPADAVLRVTYVDSKIADSFYQKKDNGTWHDLYRGDAVGYADIFMGFDTGTPRPRKVIVLVEAETIYETTA